MAKELMGAVIKAGQIEATYRVTVLGEASVKTKSKDWSDSVKSSAAGLVKLCDDLTPEIDDVIGEALRCVGHERGVGRLVRQAAGNGQVRA